MSNEYIINRLGNLEIFESRSFSSDDTGFSSWSSGTRALLYVLPKVYYVRTTLARFVHVLNSTEIAPSRPTVKQIMGKKTSKKPPMSAKNKKKIRKNVRIDRTGKTISSD